MGSENEGNFLVDEELEVSSNKSGWETLLGELKARCEAAGLGFSRESIEFFEGEIHEFANVEMPNGKDKRVIPLGGSSKVRNFLDFRFEDYVFLGDYHSFVNYKIGEIEAVISTHDQMPISSWFRRFYKLYGDPTKDETEANPIEISREDDKTSTKIILGHGSDIARQLTQRVSSPCFTIKIVGCGVTTHDSALKLLLKIANSLFFQIDSITGIALRLVKGRRLNSAPRMNVRKADIVPLVFPKHEYDEAPISLYWYAKSAYGMPLLQYLAYYQVLEFYFPTFFQKEIGRRLQALLKDPLFRVDRDADITRVLMTVRSSSAGTYGSEREQIKATINECISASELRQFFDADADRSKFFFAKKLPLNRIHLNTQAPDLRAEVAEMIYEIRCKIVHTKGDEGGDTTDILLPFSKESELLRPYLELMRFLSSKVLIAASSRLDLQ